MTTLRIIDSITDRGDPRRDNEDAFGGNRRSAFVIDGATGLGGDFLDMGVSDAAWLARLAKDSFEELAVNGRSTAEVVRVTNERARSIVLETLHDASAPAWSLPIAGFQMVRVSDDGRLHTSGLGDCRLFAVADDGRTFEASAMPDSYADEREGARAAIDVAGGLAAFKALSENPVVRDELRRRRALYNRDEGGVWTLGIEPAAASYVKTHDIALAKPIRGLLCTDGFAALVDQYGRYDAASLVNEAGSRGLVSLLGDLRRIEQRDDPDGRRFPRFKVSDDATAVLFEVV
ncbi:hypothetical protein [Mesorhizobium sp. CAU 1732]|uniref:hypothetical protein n=1 Tax=Mesorhizobium sp. CAU 1732 TaxID=3140358 RepID=UPI00326035B0